MDHYYVNNKPQTGGDHEVHAGGCYWGNKIKDRTYLGMFATCKPAVEKAKNTYPTANGCLHCSSACHTG